MKTTMSLAISVIIAFVVAGPISSVWGQDQQEPKTTRPLPPPTPPPPATPEQGGQLGGMDDMTDVNYMNLMMQVDSTMQRMTILVGESQALSKSFAELAASHHGADKSEILMMQRMSDSMGVMAGEIKMSLQQYRKMLEDETVSESGRMKAEVQSFKGMLDGIVTHIEQSLQTLELLKGQLGQG
jgi:hypothetical protein